MRRDGSERRARIAPPVAVLDRARLRRAHELAQQLREPVRIVQAGEVRRRGERAKAAVRDRLVRAAPVRRRDRVVALPPHDHRRQRLEQVQAVGRAHALALAFDHRAQRVQEGAARVGVRAQRVVAARRRRVAVADQVGSDHRVLAGQVERRRAPVARRVEHPVWISTIGGPLPATR
jgi:hypothetical protein